MSRSGKQQTAYLTGAKAERQAESYLKQQGLKTLVRNYRTRQGEIDLIMRDGQTLVFVEVRHRGHGSFADGIDSVDIFKQRKLAAAAQHYLAKQVPGQADACRFDVVSLGQRIEWVQDAFTLDQIY